MKRLLYVIIFICSMPSYIYAQIDSSFNLSRALSDMMQLEQQYSETSNTDVANELILLYKMISDNNIDTTDYFTLSRCRMLAEVHRYEEAIVLSDSLYDKDKALFKERLCLMESSYINDSSSFNLHISKVLEYLNNFTFSYTDVEDSLMQIPFDSSFSSEGIYVLLMFRLKYCYLSITNGSEEICQQLIDKAYKKGWDIDNLEWLLKKIRDFDYMSLTWW